METEVETAEAVPSESSDEGRSDIDWSSPSSWLGLAMAIAVVGFIIWLIIAFLYGKNQWSDKWGDETDFALSEYVIERYGFDPTVDHPVVFGGNVDGSTGTIEGHISMSLGFGGGSVNGSSEPSSSVTMLLPLEDGGHKIAEVPRERITFYTEGVQESFVRFNFVDVPDYGNVDVSWTYADGEGLLLFDKPVLDEWQRDITESDAWSNFEDTTLADQLLEYSDSIDVFLTEAQLTAVLD